MEYFKLKPPYNPASNGVANLETAKIFYKGERKTNVNYTVMCRNYGKEKKWLPELVVQMLSLVTYMISVGEQGKWKRHINQIIEKRVEIKQKDENIISVKRGN